MGTTFHMRPSTVFRQCRDQPCIYHVVPGKFECCKHLCKHTEMVWFRGDNICDYCGMGLGEIAMEAVK